jgi:hypothetical protein
MLDKLDAIDWGRLTHAYGQADGIPNLIRALTSPDPEHWVGALSGLYDALCHQTCTVYEATPPAIPFLLQLLGHRQVRCRGKILGFLGDAARATSYLAAHGPLSIFEKERETEEFKQQLAQELVWVRQTREAIWNGIDLYLDLLADLDRRLRIQAPYTLGLLASHAGAEMPEEVRRRDPYRLMWERMARQFEEEPNELVRASLVFGIGWLAPHRPDAVAFLRQVIADATASRPVKVSAALCHTGVASDLPAATLDVLAEALGRRSETDHLFDSDQPGIEDKHHPLAKGYRQAGYPLGEESGTGYDPDDVDKDEDFRFPWLDGWPAVMILQRLCRPGAPYQERILPTVLPYLDAANGYTADSVVRPILRLVLGDRKLTPQTVRGDLTAAQQEVLRRLYDNPLLWATEIGNIATVFRQFGLSERRQDWQRLLGIEGKPLTDAEIQALLERLAPAQQFSRERGRVKRLNLRQIGTAAFLPHLEQFSDLEHLDLSGIPLTDQDLVPLRDLPKLQRLHIPGADITDAGAEFLAGLLNLRELSLNATRITDAGLRALQRLPNLRLLGLWMVPVSAEGLRAFQAARPQCRVEQ